MERRVNLGMIVDYMLENNLTRKQFCELCNLDEYKFEFILYSGSCSLIEIYKISSATGLNKDRLMFSEPYESKIKDHIKDDKVDKLIKDIFKK